MKSNKFLPWALFWTLVLAQLSVDIIRFDFWPFSPYPMFAHPRPLDSVYAFQIKADMKSGGEKKIPVIGGAATMYIYNQRIQDKEFSPLETQMKRDLAAFLQKQDKVKLGEIAALRLVRIGLDRDPVSQVISVSETTLHRFEL